MVTTNFCPECGEHLISGSRFCGSCGHMLPEASAAAGAATPPPPPPTAPTPPGRPTPPVGTPPPVVPTPPVAPPPAAAHPAGGDSDRRRRGGLWIALAIVIALLAGSIGYLVVSHTAGASDVVLEPVGVEVPNPFTSSVNTGTESAFTAPAASTTSSVSPGAGGGVV